MKNLKSVSKKSESIIQKDRSTWITLYYSIEDDAVFTNPGVNREKVTYLINPCSPDSIKRAVERWLWM